MKKRNSLEKNEAEDQTFKEERELEDNKDRKFTWQIHHGWVDPPDDVRRFISGLLQHLTYCNVIVTCLSVSGKGVCACVCVCGGGGLLFVSLLFVFVAVVWFDNNEMSIQRESLL